MKYVLVDWPEIQEYMSLENFKDIVYFDPIKNVWFVPENVV